MTGYELDKEFKDTLAFFWSAKASQIYRELDAMQQNGWLSSKRVIQEDKPNKRVYSITEEGEKQLKEWLINYNPFEGGQKLRNPFLLRVFFGGEIGKAHTIKLLEDAQEFTSKHVDVLAEILDLFDSGEIVDDELSIDPNKQLYWKLTAQWGEIMNKAQLEWLDKALTILKEEN